MHELRTWPPGGAPRAASARRRTAWRRVLAGVALAMISSLAGCSLPPGRTEASGRDTATIGDRPALLVFTRTTSYRHASIPTAVATLRLLAAAEGLRVEHTEDAAVFDDRRLSRFRAVVFANTTGEVLDAGQREALERFVRRGGGFLGLHAAADSEYGSALHGALLVARFASHPPGLQRVVVRFSADGGRAGAWRVTDEIYRFDRDPRGHARIIATVAPDPPGRLAARPIAWCHARLGGRSWYTGLGHDPALYADPRFRQHLARGLRFVSGRSRAC